MNDLDQIHAANHRATLAHIPRERAAGKFVLAEYTGLNFAGYSAFDTRAELDQAAAKVRPIGDSFVAYDPV